MVFPREKMVAIRHEEDLLAAHRRGEFVEQAGRVAADDLVIIADHEEQLARVAFRPSMMRPSCMSSVSSKVAPA